VVLLGASGGWRAGLGGAVRDAAKGRERRDGTRFIRWAIHVRLTEKGAKLCDRLQLMRFLDRVPDLVRAQGALGPSTPLSKLDPKPRPLPDLSRLSPKAAAVGGACT
jgi:hypothetical protein